MGRNFNTSRADHRPSCGSAKHPPDDTDSDEYGSFDEEELELLNVISGYSLPQESPVPPKPVLNISSQLLTYPSLEVSARLGTFSSLEASEGQPEYESDLEASEHEPRHLGSQTATRDGVLEVQYESVAQPSTTVSRRPSSEITPASVLPLRTDDSPFDRFRGSKRGLSVTDLLSNTWCEQQFEYYLVRGKKRKTPAMKAGTKIHEKLEREVHETVAVEIKTPEDGLGLKLLNIIQGLKALRETGMTRELPVFALVRGVFVQGVIDEISYTKPVEKVYSVRDEPSSANEDNGGIELPKRRARKKEGENGANSDNLKKQQPLMSSFIVPLPIQANLNVAFISDCKTRHRDSLPTVSQSRGTELQLMLYRFLLTTMASSVQSAAEIYSKNKLSSISTGTSEMVAGGDLFSQLFATRKLNPHANFTDGFLAQIAPLLDDSDLEMDSDSVHGTTSLGVVRFPTLTHIMDNPSLAGLVQLLDISFSMSIQSISDTLAISYRSQQSSRLLATKTVEYSAQRMEAHLDQVLQWWQGQKATVGVPIEEAWKCHSCDFVDECEWRLQKIEEMNVEREREKQKKLGKGKKRAV